MKKINTAYINEKINISKDTINIYKKSFFYYKINQKYDPSSYTVSSLYGFPEGPYKIPAEKDIIFANSNAGFDKLILNSDNVIKKVTCSLILVQILKDILLIKLQNI